MKVLAVVLATALAGVAMPAAASHGDKPILYGWVKPTPRMQSTFEGTCSWDATVYGQEFGRHGVEQFKFRWRRFVGAVGDHAPAADLVYGIADDTGWLYSTRFPNDARNIWWTTRWIHSVGMKRNNFTLRVKVVGIRPSWWQPDLTADVHVGYCEALNMNVG